MSGLVRRERGGGLLSLREAMDRLLEDSFIRSPLAISVQDAFPLNIYQTEAAVIVKAALPGFTAEQIQISLTGEMLTIRAEVKEDKVVDESNYHRRERRYGSCSRTVMLPVLVIADDAKAELENGILILTLPKSTEQRGKTITIRGGRKSRK